MVTATWPVELALSVTGWRGLFWVMSALTVAAAVVIARIVPEKTRRASVEPFRSQLAALGGIFGARRFWQIAIAAMSVQATSMAVQGLWAGPWLRDVAGLSRAGVAVNLMIIAAATMTGFLFWGHFATWLARRGVSTLRVFAAGMAAFVCVQIALIAGAVRPAALLWSAIGLFGTAGSLSYALLCQRFPIELAGRVNTALNTLVFGWAFAVQWGMGLIINRWPVVEGRYDPAGYRAAFAAFLVVQLIGLAWLAFERSSTSLPPSASSSG
jgi:predicted MFS family arabinose efflux permease